MAWRKGVDEDTRILENIFDGVTLASLAVFPESAEIVGSWIPNVDKVNRSKAQTFAGR